MEKFDFSLILPCYNEAETFEESVSRIIKALDGTDYTWEIIFYDDQSIDGTQGLLKKALKNYSKRQLRAYFHKLNQGRGKTVVDGIKKAQGKIVGFIDIDLEVGEWYLTKFIKTIDEGFDMAVAWRIYDLSLSGLTRWLSSKSYNLLRKFVLGLPYKDTEAGYKFFLRKKIVPLMSKCNYKGWFWDTEIMALVFKNRLKVAEIPVAFIRKKEKTSTVRLIPDSLSYLRDLISFKIKYY